MFLSTLEEIFKGNKVLFEGCYIAQSNYDWKPYPVLYLNLAEVLNTNTEKLEASLQRSIAELATEHNVKIEIPSAQEGLKSLIKALANKGHVVVLIDEYDNPFIDRLHNREVADGNRQLLQSFFGVLKNRDKHIQFTFITGISRFSKVSVFSGANHLEDIRMDAQYAAMMGYTQEELGQYFAEHLQAITQERNAQGQPWTEEEVFAEIKDWYNGYRFSKAETYVYNPFSTSGLLQRKCLAQGCKTLTPCIYASKFVTLP